MRKQTALIAAAVIFVLLASCTGPKGPAGPSGANVLSMTFQDGISPFPSYIGVEDTYADSLNASTNYIGSNLLYVGYNTANMTVDRAFIRFDMYPLIPSNAVVVKAYLTLYAEGASASFPVIRAYRVTHSWLQPMLTWITTGLIPWTTHGGDYDPAAVSDAVTYANGNNAMTFTLNNSLVESWMNDPATNYGVVLIAQNEHISDGDEYFASSQNSDYFRPKLTVYYTLP